MAVTDHARQPFLKAPFGTVKHRAETAVGPWAPHRWTAVSKHPGRASLAALVRNWTIYGPS